MATRFTTNASLRNKRKQRAFFRKAAPKRAAFFVLCWKNRGWCFSIQSVKRNICVEEILHE